jgi:hypothetical protein
MINSTTHPAGPLVPYQTDLHNWLKVFDSCNTEITSMAGLLTNVVHLFTFMLALRRFIRWYTPPAKSNVPISKTAGLAGPAGLVSKPELNYRMDP